MSEGLALGLAALGYERLLDLGEHVDDAFAVAWAGWAYQGTFRRVSYDVAKGLDGLHVVTQARWTKETTVLYWSRDGELRISSRLDGWSAQCAEDLFLAAQAVPGGVPLSGWVALALEFLRGYLPSDSDSVLVEDFLRQAREGSTAKCSRLPAVRAGVHLTLVSCPCTPPSLDERWPADPWGSTQGAGRRRKTD